MAITGQENALANSLTSAIVASIQATFGNILGQQEQQGIHALSQGIANGLIPFLTSNIQVNLSGELVSVPALGLTVTVTDETIPVMGTATGTVETNGTIS
jgi:uncharacterized membrane protein (UPF0136 family)